MEAKLGEATAAHDALVLLRNSLEGKLEGAEDLIGRLTVERDALKGAARGPGRGRQGEGEERGEGVSRAAACRARRSSQLAP